MNVLMPHARTEPPTVCHKVNNQYSRTRVKETVIRTVIRVLSSSVDMLVYITVGQVHRSYFDEHIVTACSLLLVLIASWSWCGHFTYVVCSHLYTDISTNMI